MTPTVATTTDQKTTNHKLRHKYTSSVQWLPADDIQAEPLVTNRPFDPAFAKKLAKEFDPDLVGFPLVVKVGIRLVAIDGQHRIAAARMAFGEGQRIQCELVEGISVIRAAQLFLGRNSRRNVNPLSKFMVGVTAKDTTVLAINDAVNKAGWHVGAGTSGNNTVAAVASLMRIYRLKNSADLVGEVLTVIRNAWGDDSTNTYGDFMVALALVLDRYPEIDKHQLIQRLRKLSSVHRVIGTARALREGLGGSVSINIARSLITLYNHGRQTKGKLAEWGTTVTATAAAGF